MPASDPNAVANRSGVPSVPVARRLHPFAGLIAIQSGKGEMLGGLHIDPFEKEECGAKAGLGATHGAEIGEAFAALG